MTWEVVNRYDKTAKSTDCWGVDDNKTVIFSGRRDQADAIEARVGESDKVSPMGVTIGVWIINLLEGEAVGKKAKDGAIVARPFGVVYAVKIVPFTVSELVPCESLPTKLKPAPALVWRSMAVAEPLWIRAHCFVSVPKPTCSATSYT